MSTIQIWIDLWTTNSSIAYNNSWKIEIIKNFEMDEFTPSVFGYDKSKNALVWKRAFEKLYKYADKEDIQNFKWEVKRLMWTPENTFFPRVNKNMQAEEISAEILKYLKTTILKKYPNIDTTWVIITIPAHFSTLESEATKRAWELAWFKQVVLLQEPIAAAVSYWFSKEINATWLVYDLWWWTFDTAIIQSKDWLLNILASKWDNFLWWKDFDWAVVDNIFIPRINEKFNMLNFNRWNEKYKNIFNILKWIAEDTKKKLTYDEEINVEIEKVWNDDDWEEIYLTFTITKEEFEDLVLPFVSKSIKLVEETIKEAWIDKNSINKIILVWWSTQTPLVRNELEKALKISIDSSVDPLTVVASWASIYATTQVIKEEFKNNPVSLNTIKLKLNYDTVSTEDEEVISWKLEWLDNNKEYYLQIQSESGYFSSNRILIKQGKFITNVKIEAWKANTYWVYIFDEQWDTLELDNDSFTITHWLTIWSIPIPYNIWVAIAKKSAFSVMQNEMFWNKEKNAKLPLSISKEFKTSKTLSKWSHSNALPIKVYEWESEIPDRNTYICDLWISWTDIPYDLEEWTPIEITIDVDTSRQLSVKAYIPSIDLSLNARKTELNEKINLNSLQNDLQNEKKRFESIEWALSMREKWELEEEMNYVEQTISSAWTDEDSKRKADKKLRDFKIKLDITEKGSKFDILVERFNNICSWLDNFFLNDYNNEEDKVFYEDIKSSVDYSTIKQWELQYQNIKIAWDSAIKNQDSLLLANTNEQLAQLQINQICDNSFIMNIHWYNECKTWWYNFTDKNEAERLFRLWEQAINSEDKNTLKDVVSGLINLTPWKQIWWMSKILTGLAGITL